MHILFIGDIVGRPGRQCVKELLPKLCKKYAIDITLANAENAAGGLGITPRMVEELQDYGVNAFTMGNHTWRKQEMVDAIDSFSNIARPANYPARAPGQGAVIVSTRNGPSVGVVSVMGRVFMEPFDCPFEAARKAVETLKKTTPIILVDIHAEATSEKVAMGRYLDGKCTAVVGTHTHVQTADERLLPRGTAYISDVGMTGPADSVIGVEVGAVIRKFTTGIPTKFQVAKGRAFLNGVVIDADDETGSARSIQRIYVHADEDL